MTEDRRRQIIAAARSMLSEDPHTTLSVRAVAERAGVGASTLRHHFPTQRSLHEVVYESFFEGSAGDLRIRDTSVPARERLRECLLQLLPPPHAPDVPLDSWIAAISSVFGSSASAEARAGWFSSVIRTRRQIVEWLHVLSHEGAVAGGSEERSARLLVTVIDGLSYERVIPASRLDPDVEAAVIEDALTAVLRSP